jgi:gamma-glutamyltranspeptidase / glutathione hydrolase
MKFCVLLLAAALSLHGQEAESFEGIGRDYGRSMTITRQGIVATSQILASQAGAQMLARGGSAVDAAIAANAVLAVVEPMMNGLGGDCFAIRWDSKTGKLTGINASGPAPRALTPALLAGSGIRKMPERGIHSVTVPGAVDGWATMHARFGRLPWKELFQPAIAYARDGFPVSEVIAEAWARGADRLKHDKNSMASFLPEGRPPKTGELFRNPDLARALGILAEQGRDAFYQGAIAEAILKTSRGLHGVMTAQDLGSFKSEWVEPISIDYRGWRVYELPPNGQGMAALEMLNLMQTVPASPAGALSAAEMHRRIESMKLAYSDLHRYGADPRSSRIPVETLISMPYAKKRAALIDPARANCKVAPGEAVPSDTTYLTVVDREGNIVSWIQSLSAAWGSGITVEGMGFELQNRGSGFTLDPKSPNVLAGGKRPFHTIIPAFMERGDQHIGFGIMGGPNQPLAHAQFVSNVADYGMNIQQALELPRFTKANAAGCELSMESRVPLSTLQQLSDRGHLIRIRRPYTQEMGRGQAILHDSKTGINYGASGPRADGAAIPEPILK